jgi:hypothetical protein
VDRSPRGRTPALSRFSPLSRILFFDDFDRGLNGWTALIGNNEGTLDSMLPEYRDLRPPMLSNLSMWDTGTVGALDGTYAMKLATRPKASSLAVAVKRLTWRHAGPIQMEVFFTYKPEAVALELLDTGVRAFGFALDIQVGDRATGPVERVMPHLRYLNALDGRPVERWQFKRAIEPLRDIGGRGKTRSHFHLAATGWEDVPGGRSACATTRSPRSTTGITCRSGSIWSRCRSRGFGATTGCLIRRRSRRCGFRRCRTSGACSTL